MKKYNVRDNPSMSRSTSVKSLLINNSGITKLSQKTKPLEKLIIHRTKSIDRSSSQFAFKKDASKTVFRELRGEVDKLLSSINKY